MTDTHAWEKFYFAVLGMAASPADLKQRIANAYTSHLHVVKVNELPENVRDSFIEMLNRLTEPNPVGSGRRIKTSLNKMTQSEATEIAKLIVTIYEGLEAAKNVDDE